MQYYTCMAAVMNSMSQLKVTLIVPSVVSHALDVHTGIPFMPHMAAYLASSLRETGHQVKVIDCFGEDFRNVERVNDFYFFGLDNRSISARIDKDCKIVFVYCRTIEDLISSQLICEHLRSLRPDIRIILFENIQTVNSFSLKEIAQDLVPKFADIAVMGEPELRAGTLVEAALSLEKIMLQKIAGIVFFDEIKNEVVFTNKETFNNELDKISFPAWDLFNLSGYWEARFAHAPVKKSTKFLPLLTSRGCPYRCTFCVSPAINPTWRARSAENVVSEILYFKQNFGITDFHVSDLDPTISDSRIQSISTLLIASKANITWKIAQGTKIETIKSIETLSLMQRSGCTFFSFSPETGSQRLLKIMNKRFDKKHANRLLKHMNQIGLRTQACFIAGVPGENWVDRFKTLGYVSKLVHLGVDEIAMTIFTPIPGAALSKSMSGFVHYSELSHSPRWRKDFITISFFRYLTYALFFTLKLTKPRKIIREISSIKSLNFETKMEMSLYKFFRIRNLANKSLGIKSN
jgi:anaerobic magnesium-protoporphyrin IX monomethyl ester cyclase